MRRSLACLWSCQCPVSPAACSWVGLFGFVYCIIFPSLRLSPPQETFTEDCKFRERFQENSYNTYASVAHGGRRSGRQWYVALNKRGKAKMGSSPRVKAQHVSTHFLPRFSLHERIQHGFTITERGQETKTPPHRNSPKAPAPKTSIGTGQRQTQPVKYWPKYRFG